MGGFPMLAHPMTKYKTILVRESYVVIFAELMEKVKACFKEKSDSNMIVTGNPGVGKSRFYLYFIFQLVTEYAADLKRLDFQLVLNCNNDFQIYCPETREFAVLTDADVTALRDKNRVIRLIEGDSSILNSWHGVSILFAAPGLLGMNNYAKVESYTYLLPAWSFDELEDYNELLSDKLKLSDNNLLSRYTTYGGIPRFIFTGNDDELETTLNSAIEFFKASDIINYATEYFLYANVRERNYSHRVFEMVPSESDFRAAFYIDFLSKYVAEKIVAKVSDDKLQEVSKLAMAYDDMGSTSGVRGTIYEILCHKWLSLPQQYSLELRPLCSAQESTSFIIPEELSTVRFSSLDDVEVVQRGVYYRPRSKSFNAMDGFILIGDQCLGLQMTLNWNHGIKAAPLNTFLKWLEGVGISTTQFYFAFVVPSKLERSFEKQVIRTKSDSTTKKPGASARVNQFVAALDVFVDGK